MTILLYQTNSYIQSFQAFIEAVDAEGCAVVLDQTAFFPGGGGQPSDRGTLIAGDHVFHVKSARKEDDRVFHFIENGVNLPAVGTCIRGQIDWEMRYQLMRTHTAMHILCGVIFRDYGASVTGGDMQPLKGRMDFEFETMRKELVTEIEDTINLEVRKARAVKVCILPRDEAF